jgi:hypothetical protein
MRVRVAAHPGWGYIMSQKSANQGKGDRESAKRHNRNTHEFVASGKIDEAAKRAGDGEAQPVCVERLALDLVPRLPSMGKET